MTTKSTSCSSSSFSSSLGCACACSETNKAPLCEHYLHGNSLFVRTISMHTDTGNVDKHQRALGRFLHARTHCPAKSATVPVHQHCTAVHVVAGTYFCDGKVDPGVLRASRSQGAARCKVPRGAAVLFYGHVDFTRQDMHFCCPDRWRPFTTAVLRGHSWATAPVWEALPSTM